MGMHLIDDDERRELQRKAFWYETVVWCFTIWFCWIVGHAFWVVHETKVAAHEAQVQFEQSIQLK